MERFRDCFWLDFAKRSENSVAYCIILLKQMVHMNIFYPRAVILQACRKVVELSNLTAQLCLCSRNFGGYMFMSWSNMAMDNRSIAAFIETNRTRINSVIICLPGKGAGQEKRTNTKYTTRKSGRIRGRRWESKAASNSELASSCDLSKNPGGG